MFGLRLTVLSSVASFLVTFGVGVLIPVFQIGEIGHTFKVDDGVVTDVFPVDRVGDALAGRKVYAEEGCATCHTQVLRSLFTGDTERTWGSRKSVPRDYLGDSIPLIGAMRFGPDLSNFGSEKWSLYSSADPRGKAPRTESAILAHLCSPQSFVEASWMPSYRHLFESVGDGVIVDQSGGQGGAVGRVLVGLRPLKKARDLVAYLNSLRLTDDSAATAIGSGVK
jgi:cytochrome c oxidase cbb3-type subunit 2